MKIGINENTSYQIIDGITLIQDDIKSLQKNVNDLESSANYHDEKIKELESLANYHDEKIKELEDLTEELDFRLNDINQDIHIIIVILTIIGIISIYTFLKVITLI